MSKANISRPLRAAMLGFLLVFTVGCVDDAAGIFDGTLVTSSDDVALMRLVMNRNGQTSINLQTTDRERTDIVLWGLSNGNADDNKISFKGVDTSTGGLVSLELTLSDATVSGELALASLDGNFQLQRVIESAQGDGFTLTGRYGRNQSNGEVIELDISEAGTVAVSGACQGAGYVKSSNAQLNIYELRTYAACLDIDVLLTREQLTSPGDVLSLSGVSSTEGYAADFYRQ